MKFSPEALNAGPHCADTERKQAAEPGRTPHLCEATPPAVRFVNEWISMHKHDIRRLENASRHDQVCCSAHVSCHDQGVLLSPCLGLRKRRGKHAVHFLSKIEGAWNSIKCGAVTESCGHVQAVFNTMLGPQILRDFSEDAPSVRLHGLSQDRFPSWWLAPCGLHWQNTGEPIYLGVPFRVPSGIPCCLQEVIRLHYVSLGGAMQCSKSC